MELGMGYTLRGKERRMLPQNRIKSFVSRLTLPSLVSPRFTDEGRDRGWYVRVRHSSARLVAAWKASRK